jgi:hypothetical protein
MIYLLMIWVLGENDFLLATSLIIGNDLGILGNLAQTLTILLQLNRGS